MPSTRSQVIRKVKRYWPDMDSVQAMKILDQYGVEKYERERERVQLAMLKLCEGKLERLNDLVKIAKGDYRDILAWAEYPQEIKLGFVKMKHLSKEEAEAIRRQDREQYLDWFEEN